MDDPTNLSERLQAYATTLLACGTKGGNEIALESWLGYWDDETSAFANIRNIEHWLRHTPVPSR